MQMFDALIFLLVVVGLTLLWFLLFRRDKLPFKKKKKDLNGDAASAKVVAATKRYALMQGYQVIAPAHLAKNGKFADIDCILVGAFGLLCVKCIGLGGEIYGNADDAKWLQVKTDTRTPFENPLQQAAADTRLVRDALFEGKLKSVPVETVCVFTNRKAQLVLPRSTGHYTLKDYQALLGKDRFLQDKKVDIEKAAAAVTAYLAPRS